MGASIDVSWSDREVTYVEQGVTRQELLHVDPDFLPGDPRILTSVARRGRNECQIGVCEP